MTPPEIKEKHPTWFKMKLDRRELIRQLSPETAVNVLLACLEFLETGEKPTGLSPIESVAFSAFIPDMEEAWARYIQRITTKKNRAVSTDTLRPRAASNETEEETEEEAEEETETEEDSKKESVGAGKPRRPPSEKPVRKKYGQYGWVRLTNSDYNRLLNDFGQAEAERCIAYVDESAQSSGNKNKWRDWNLVIRRCHRDGWGLSQQQSAMPRNNRARTDADYEGGDSFV